MPWKVNRKLVARGFRGLKYLPREKCGWDATLACLAYGTRMDIERRPADLNAWAARHCVPASGRCRDLGSDALVLWHGTSRQRAEKIGEHGLFHKKGVWAAVHPDVPHSFCRGRSERFRTEGAVVCLVFDRSELVEGRDFDTEGKGNVYRFHHRLPPDVVEYVLVHEEVLFVGDRRAREPSPWPRARFKKRSGKWAPVQRAPVRYSGSVSYSSVEEFARVTVRRLLEELVEVTALEVFSCLRAGIAPWDAMTQEDIFDLIEEECVRRRQLRGCRLFRAREAAT